MCVCVDVVGKLSLYSGVLALGVGDSMAAVAGSLMGKTKWPGIITIIIYSSRCTVCVCVCRDQENSGGFHDVDTHSIIGCHGDCNHR